MERRGMVWIVSADGALQTTLDAAVTAWGAEPLGFASLREAAVMADGRTAEPSDLPAPSSARGGRPSNAGSGAGPLLVAVQTRGAPETEEPWLLRRLVAALPGSAIVLGGDVETGCRLLPVLDQASDVYVRPRLEPRALQCVLDDVWHRLARRAGARRAAG